ncbi:MAG: GntR family transcriptional regulator [Clostridiales bacterium]|nr:GntR family transcriptional regulator [Clostridiales bacterium]
MAKDFFLYENVYSDLKHKISSGMLKPGDKLDTEPEMEKLYNVSAITVKKALSLLVDEGLIERVRGRGTFVLGRTEQAADQTAKAGREYGTGESLGEEREPVIGVIFEHISSSFGLQMLYEFEREARKAGYYLFPCFSYGEQALEAQTIRYLLKTGAKGLIVMPAHGNHYNTELLKLVIEEFPVVLIDKKLEGIPLDSVRSDGEQSMKQLVDYFAEKGKKKIGLVTVEVNGTSSLIDRKQGFYLGMEEHHLIPRRECTLPFVDYEKPYESFREIYRARIGEYLDEMQDELDGIVCSEYGVAMEVVAELEKRKLFDEIEVICIDENYIGEDQYRLTHIKQDEKKIARCALEILLEKIEGKKGEQREYLIPGIFTRKI